MGILSVEPDGLVEIGHGPWEIAFGMVRIATIVKGGGIIGSVDEWLVQVGDGAVGLRLYCTSAWVVDEVCLGIETGTLRTSPQLRGRDRA